MLGRSSNVKLGRHSSDKHKTKQTPKLIRTGHKQVLKQTKIEGFFINKQHGRVDEVSANDGKKI